MDLVEYIVDRALGADVTLLQWLYVWTVIYPLAILYAKGPRYHSFGMWGGADAADICHDLSGFGASTWHEAPAACRREIAQRFDAFLIMVALACIALIGYHVCALLWYHCVIASFGLRRERMYATARQLAKMELMRKVATIESAPSTKGVLRQRHPPGYVLVPVPYDCEDRECRNTREAYQTFTANHGNAPTQPLVYD